MATNPDPVDVHVGKRVRMRRMLLGMSQERLGTALGLTFQQVQKYERGANRIGSSRLYRISRILDVPISYFFEDLDIGEKAATSGFSEDGPSYDADIVSQRESLELLRAYYRIDNAMLRKRVLELVRSVGERER